MKLTCQIVIFVLLVIAFFLALYQDFNGKNETKPHGFKGAVATVIYFVLYGLCLYGAGAFTMLSNNQ